MVAALLGEGISVLRDVPDISDVDIVSGLLVLHGVSITAGAGPGGGRRIDLLDGMASAWRLF